MNAYEEEKVNSKNDVINIFEQFDKDSNGQINFEELKYMLAELYPLNSLGVYSDWFNSSQLNYSSFCLIAYKDDNKQI